MNSSRSTASSTSPPVEAMSSSADSVSRADPPPWMSADSIASWRQVVPGVCGHPLHVLGQRVGRQQMELQVLGARPNGVAHLLRVGGGQHEHDVWRRLFQRLEQRSLGGLGEHVDFVEDVHLVPTGRTERRLFDEIANGLDAIVRRGVELVDVVARALFNSETRIALAARLAVDDVGAVEHLGKNASRGGLPRATRP